MQNVFIENIFSRVYFSNLLGIFSCSKMSQKVTFIFEMNFTPSKLNHFMNYLLLAFPSSLSGIRFLKLSRLWERWFNMIVSRSISLWSLGAVNSQTNHSGDERELALAELWHVAASTSKSSFIKNEITQQLLYFLCLCLRCLNASNSRVIRVFEAPNIKYDR